MQFKLIIICRKEQLNISGEILNQCNTCHLITTLMLIQNFMEDALQYLTHIRGIDWTTIKEFIIRLIFIYRLFFHRQRSQLSVHFRTWKHIVSYNSFLRIRICQHYFTGDWVHISFFERKKKLEKYLYPLIIIFPQKVNKLCKWT